MARGWGQIIVVGDKGRAQVLRRFPKQTRDCLDEAWKNPVNFTVVSHPPRSVVMRAAHHAPPLAGLRHGRTRVRKGLRLRARAVQPVQGAHYAGVGAGGRGWCLTCCVVRACAASYVQSVISFEPTVVEVPKFVSYRNLSECCCGPSPLLPPPPCTLSLTSAPRPRH